MSTMFTRAVCIQIAGKMPYLEMEKNVTNTQIYNIF